MKYEIEKEGQNLKILRSYKQLRLLDWAMEQLCNTEMKEMKDLRTVILRMQEIWNLI